MLRRLDPRPIALARIGLGIATIVNALEMYVLLSGIAEDRFAMPVLTWLPPPTSLAVTTYLVVAVASGVAITAGYHVGLAALASTVLSVGVFLWDQQTYSSHRWLALLLVTYLVFARSDSIWSIQRRHGGVPFWPQLLMMTQLSVCYFFAAISKVNGAFLSGVPLSKWVWLPLPSWVFVLMAWATIVTEIFMAVALWTRRARHVAVALGISLHLSIVFMLADHTLPLIAFTLTCLAVYPLFLTRPEAHSAATDNSAGLKTPAATNGRSDG